jgi:uncharacterized membrane protein HdeD (DUF308 family)
MARMSAPQTSYRNQSYRSQRTLAFRGVLLLIFGLAEGAMLLLAFRVPDITTSLLIIVLTTFVILDALATLFEAAGVRSPRPVWTLLLVCKAAIGLLAAVAIVLRPRSQALPTFAWWALLTGLLEGLEALMLGGQRHWRLVVAGLSIAFGLLVLAGPRRETAVLVLVAGVYGVVAGSVRLVAARRSASPSRLIVPGRRW